jgi:hypothetical protein
VSITASRPAAFARAAAASSITPSCSHTRLRAHRDRLVDHRPDEFAADEAVHDVDRPGTAASVG